MNQNQEVFAYKIKQKNKNPYDSLIIKTGLTAEFTINDIRNEIDALNKRKIEIEAKKGISDATIKNIKEHDKTGVINKISEKERIAIFLYEKAMIEIKAADELVKEINNQLDSYGAEIEDICKQTKLKIEVPKND